MSEKTCPICGKPTNIYMGRARKDGLCREHGKLANAGELIRCPICYTWRNPNEKCPECEMEALEDVVEQIEETTNQLDEENNVIVINEKNKNKIISYTHLLLRF